MGMEDAIRDEDARNRLIENLKQEIVDLRRGKHEL